MICRIAASIHMKFVPNDRAVYSFSRQQNPVEHVDPGELILLEVEDAVGGQIKDDSASLGELDWSRVDQATGPVYVEGAEQGDTLVVDILDIELPNRGVIVVVPKAGVLAEREFSSKARMVEISHGFVTFKDVRLKLRPVVGTIGVAPYGEPAQSSVPYKHGGNLDCAEMTKGVRLYLPVATSGALFAAGDLHAVQEDGELCVASVEMAGKILLKFDVIKGRQAEWPIIETRDHFSILTADESLDVAVKIAAEKAVEAIMKAKSWSFEEAYMLSSLVVKVAINQVVDPKKGARASIPKEIVTLPDLLA